MFKLDRPHRFAVGDLVTHVDAPTDGMTVTDLTLRIADGDDYPTMAYPTYTLREPWPAFDDVVEDVLCTDDLIHAPAFARGDAYSL